MTPIKEAFETWYFEQIGITFAEAQQRGVTDLALLQSCWQSATERAAKQAPEAFPTRLHVSFAPGDWDTFFYGVSGKMTMEALTEIDALLRDEDSGSLFDQGAGEYLIAASYFKGQYGFEGRCEIQPGWELSVESFVPRAAAIRGDGGGT